MTYYGPLSNLHTIVHEELYFNCQIALDPYAFHAIVKYVVYNGNFDWMNKSSRNRSLKQQQA